MTTSAKLMQVHAVTKGSGTPVLMIHGFGVDHRLMLGLAEPAFADRVGWYRHYIDMPGMGATPASDVGSADDVIAAVLNYIDQQWGSEPFALIGQSYGTVVARGVLSQLPDQVVGMALIAGTGVVDPAQRTLPEQTVLRHDDDLLDSLDPEQAQLYCDHAVVQSSSSWQRFRDEILPGIKAADQDALARIASNYGPSEEPEQRLGSYAGPVLIINGRQDHVAGYADSWSLLEHYPRATMTILDGAGHNLHIEQQGLVDQLLGEWLDRISARCGA